MTRLMILSALVLVGCDLPGGPSTATPAKGDAAADTEAGPNVAKLPTPEEPPVGQRWVVVDTTADLEESDTACSLRMAILRANRLPDVEEIHFAIPETDSGFDPATRTFRIHPVRSLPTITHPVILDATTQPGYAVIELHGWGLCIGADHCKVRGLAIAGPPASGSNGIGILIQGAGTTVDGGFIGPHVTDERAAGNDGGGPNGGQTPH